jgi:hypothetical protein
VGDAVLVVVIRFLVVIVEKVVVLAVVVVVLPGSWPPSAETMLSKKPGFL